MEIQIPDIAKDWLSGNPELWQIVVGLVITISLVVQRLASIREVWFNYRKGLSNLTLEKHQLEVLKLKYEIEAIKKTHGLLEPPPHLILEDIPKEIQKETVKIVEEEIPPSHIWTWLTRHPLFGEFLLRSTQIIVGFYLFAFGVGVVMMPFMGFIDPEFGKEPWLVAIGWVMYVALTYACYKGYRKIQNRIVKFRLATKKH